MFPEPYNCIGHIPVMECKPAFPHEKFYVRVLVVLLVVIRLLYIGTVLLLAGLRNALNGTEFQLSLVAQTDPMRAVASFFHPINAVIIAVVNGLHFRRIKPTLHTNWHFCSWYAQFVSTSLLALGLIGIGAVPLSVNSRLYYIFLACWYIGAVFQICLSATLGRMVDLIVPMWLILFRVFSAFLAAAAGILIISTIGWFPLGVSIGELILCIITVLYFATYAHASDFPCRSRSLKAYPVSVPPVVYYNEMKNERTVVRLLVTAFVVVALIFLTLVYLLSALRHTITYPSIYISDTLGTDPGRAIGAYLIPLLVTAVLGVIALRLIRMRPLIEDNDVVCKGLFVAACVFLIGTFVGFIGAAAVPLTTNDWVHWAAAIIGFASAILLLLSLTILDDRLELIRPERLRQVRMVLVTLLVIFGILMALVFVWSTIAAVISELLSVVTFAIYFVTYGHSCEFPLKSSKPRPPDVDPDPYPSTPPV